MSLHVDLLKQSKQLAHLDPRRPKQVNLRRAISSAYYALFHLLTSEASALYAAEFELAARINRTLNHGEMRKVSSMIANNKLPKGVQAPGGGYITPRELKTVANAFVNLQQARHEADYDLARTFSRKQAMEFVQMAREAFETWGKVRKTDDARLYLACFHLWKRWDEDPR
jgi:uncharacterized protein (UPF0332 family)